MTEVLFNTMEVSNMLQVDKSTVKRWTDEGKLKCFRTPGGHRKFRAEDLYQFISDYSYGISLTNLYPQFASDEAIIRRIITRREYNVLTNVCFSAAIHGRKDEVVKLFNELYKNGLTLPVLFDEILLSAVKRISDLTNSGKLSSAESQLAYSALSNGVVLLSDIVMRSAPTGRIAICSTVELDAHEFVLNALTVLLESEGIEVLNLGLGAATETICQLIEAKKPHYVFLCAFHVSNSDGFVHKLKGVSEAAERCGAKVVVGGKAQGYQSSSGDSPLTNIVHCETFKDFANLQHSIPGHLAKLTRTKGK